MGTIAEVRGRIAEVEAFRGRERIRVSNTRGFRVVVWRRGSPQPKSPKAASRRIGHKL